MVNFFGRGDIFREGLAIIWEAGLTFFREGVAIFLGGVEIFSGGVDFFSEFHTHLEHFSTPSIFRNPPPLHEKNLNPSRT